MKLIVCPNDEKLRILEDNNKNSNLDNIKFMTKNEFMSNYFFNYGNKAARLPIYQEINPLQNGNTVISLDKDTYLFENIKRF